MPVIDTRKGGGSPFTPSPGDYPDNWISTSSPIVVTTSKVVTVDEAISLQIVDAGADINITLPDPTLGDYKFAFELRTGRAVFDAGGVDIGEEAGVDTYLLQVIGKAVTFQTDPIANKYVIRQSSQDDIIGTAKKAYATSQTPEIVGDVKLVDSIEDISGPQLGSLSVTITATLDRLRRFTYDSGVLVGEVLEGTMRITAKTRNATSGSKEVILQQRLVVVEADQITEREIARTILSEPIAYSVEPGVYSAQLHYPPFTIGPGETLGIVSYAQTTGSGGNPQLETFVDGDGISPNGPPGTSAVFEVPADTARADHTKLRNIKHSAETVTGLELNGVDEYAEQDSSAFGLLSSFCIESRESPATIVGTKKTISKYKVAGGYQVAQVDGELMVWLNDGVSVATVETNTSPLEADTTKCFQVLYDSSIPEVSIRADGVEIASATNATQTNCVLVGTIPTSITDSGDVLGVGGDAFFYDGKMHYLAISSTLPAIGETLNPEDCVGYWDFNGSLQDISGNGHTLTGFNIDSTNFVDVAAHESQKHLVEEHARMVKAQHDNGGTFIGVWTPGFSFDTPGSMSVGAAVVDTGDFKYDQGWVTANYKLRATITKGTASGALRITGFPFALSSAAAANNSGVISELYSQTNAADVTLPSGTMSSKLLSNGEFKAKFQDSQSSPSTLNSGQLAAVTDLTIDGSFTVKVL